MRDRVKQMSYTCRQEVGLIILQLTEYLVEEHQQERKTATDQKELLMAKPSPAPHALKRDYYLVLELV